MAETWQCAEGETVADAVAAGSGIIAGPPPGVGIAPGGMPLPEASGANCSIKNPERYPPVNPIMGNANHAGRSFAI